MHVLGFALALVLGGVLPRAQGPEGTAVVRGRVVDAGSGKPLAGLALQLYAQQRGPYAPGIGARPPVRSAITGPDGAFTVERLVAADYSITARASGDYLDISKRVIVGEGAQVDVVIRATRSAGITGHVFDERGRPVVGANVRVFTKDPNVFGSATTDDLGEYAIGRLRAGNYAVGVTITLANRTLAMAPAGGGSSQPWWLTQYVLDRAQRTIMLSYGAPFPATADDGRPQVFTTAFSGRASTLAAAQYIELDAGETRTNVDVTLPAFRGTRVSGVVTSPTKIAGTILTLTPEQADSPGDGGRITATAALDGTFVFLAVPPGKYSLTAYRRQPPLTDVSIANGAPMIAMDDVIGRDEDDLWADVPLGVGDADVDDLAVAMRQGTPFAGRIVFDDEVYSAASGSQTPRVVLAGSPRSYDFEADRHVTFSRAGSFSMRIKPGTYRVLSQSTIQGRVFRTAIVNGIELGDAPLVVGNDPLTDVKFVFARYETALRGSVKGSNADPAVDANVVLFPADKARWYRLSDSSLGHLMRTADGEYQFIGIAPGDYYVTAIDNFQFGFSEQSVAALVAGAARVTIRAGAPLTLDLVLRSPQ